MPVFVPKIFLPLITQQEEILGVEEVEAEIMKVAEVENIKQLTKDEIAAYFILALLSLDKNSVDESVQEFILNELMRKYNFI